MPDERRPEPPPAPAGTVRRSRPSPYTQPINRIQPAADARPERADNGYHPPADSFFAPIAPGQPGAQDGPGAPVGPSRGERGAGPPPPTTPTSFRRPGRRRPRSRLPLVAGTVAVLLVLCGVAFGVQHLATGGSSKPIAAGVPPAEPTGVQGPAESPGAAVTPLAEATPVIPRTGAADKVKLGVFLGTSQSGVRSFGDWLGREPDYAVDFSTRSTWNDIANPHYMIDQWRGSDYRMVYSVALLPWNGDASIKAGARGDYDQYFRTLARNLVAGGQEDAILRLGWEFNLKGWKWSTDNPDEFISYWKHIVTAMRSVPGGDELEFDWNPNVGETPYAANLYYPGNKYVDYIGVDVYDLSWDGQYPYPKGCDADCRLDRQGQVWEKIYGGKYGLAYWSDFARAKDKPMSLPEWGLWRRSDGRGGGDNPFFIKQVFAFIDDPHNRVAYQGYLQVDVADGQHKLSTLKDAGKAYKKLFK